MSSLFPWVLALTVGGTTLLVLQGSGPWPALAGTLLLQIVPGLLLQRVLVRGPQPAVVRLAAVFLLPWCAHGVVAVVTGALRWPLLVPALMVPTVGAIAAWRSSRAGPGPAVWVWDRFSVVSTSLAGLALLLALFAPARFGLNSDVYAHVAGVTACVEEDLVFPEHEFHRPEDGLGTDPRFGTAHALLGAGRQLGGADPIQAWKVHTAVSAAGFLLAVGALASASFGGLFARLLVLMGFAGAYAGTLYNPLEIGAYPLWLGLASMFLLWAVLLPRGGVPQGTSARALALVLLVGCATIHALAFILLGLSVLALLLARGREPGNLDRWRGWVVPVAMGLPLVALRVALSYGNANPIHQRPWNVLEWSEGLYSINPIFLGAFLGPVGWIVLIASAAFLRARTLRENLAVRWSLVAAVLSVAWITLPFLLTPSLHVLGFLPLRFVMLVLFPILLGAIVEGPGARPSMRRVAGILVLTLLSLAFAGRARDLLADRHGPAVEEGEWAQLRERLASLPMGVVLSDPYTMIVLAALGDFPIVAVPDGRSSPRDPEPIARLRDAWRAMHACASSGEIHQILESRHVDYLLLQRRFDHDLHGYEYALDTESFAAQLERFRSDSQRFEPLWSSQNMDLFQVRRSVPPATLDAVDEHCPCPTVPAQAAESALILRDGYRLREVRVVYDRDERALRLSGWIETLSSDPAPDRRLVIRLDPVESPVPATLRFFEKPVRKFLEKVRRVRYRARWTALPQDGACPLWLAGEGRALALDLRLPVPPSLAPGRYQATVQASDLTEFTPLHWSDLTQEIDVYSGPVAGVVEVE